MSEIYIKVRDNGGMWYDRATGKDYVSKKVYKVEETASITAALRANALVKLDSAEGEEALVAQEARQVLIKKAEQAAIANGTPTNVIIAEDVLAEVKEPKVDESDSAPVVVVEDLSKLSFKALQQKAADLGLEIPKDAGKSALIELINAKLNLAE